MLASTSNEEGKLFRSKGYGVNEIFYISELVCNKSQVYLAAAIK